MWAFSQSDVSYLSTELSRWELAEYISSALVALGCIGEAISDFTNWFTDGVEGRKKRLAKGSTFLLIAALSLELVCLVKTNELSGRVIGSLGVEAEDADRKARKALEDSGTAISKSGEASTKANTAVDASIKADEKSNKASTSANAALALSDSARKEAASFEKDIVSAKNKAAEAESHLADALQRAAHAESEADEEHLARVNLEQQLSWRDITPEQGGRIARRILPFFGQQIDFVTYSNEGECLNFENVLYRVVLSGHWVLDPKRQWSMLGATIIGIEIQVSESAEKHTKDAASALADALNAEDIFSHVTTIPASDAPKAAVIIVAVGKNPNSMRPIKP